MLCLLGAARCSHSDTISCPCPNIPLRNLTKTPEEKCYQLNSLYRYQCIDGYVRKAGSSNLIRCREDKGKISWSSYKMECIPDPKIMTTTQPPVIDTISCPCPKIEQRNLTKAPEEKCYQVNSTYRYQCIDGYVRKAGSSNLIICLDDDGKISWSSYKMECIPDPKTTTTTQPPVTAASISEQMINGTSVSAPQTTGTSSTEQNSGVSHVLENITQHTTTKTDSTTSTTTDSSSGKDRQDSKIDRTQTAVRISCISLVIICFFIGIGLCWYKRRKRNYNPQPTEEELPMNIASP
ncbi:hypothetical protein Q5P01_003402 [Channa striata]|uniref:Sushi domain-containing protein n=1 Tax=Channa striata TaxID=64152 RepID=A0AA88T965_CHASR|nr:hypothetical protein Q5P01_003402 [Channa striata]